MTNGHEEQLEQAPLSDLSLLESTREGVSYQTRSYDWTQPIPIQSSEGSNTAEQPPSYVVLPYVCLG